MAQKMVIVGGCGHVGLPLGLAFADHGLDVTLLDIDRRKVDQVNAGKMPFREKDGDALLRRTAGLRLRATLDPECLQAAQVVITVVGTPVDKHLNPTGKELYSSVDQLLFWMTDQSMPGLVSTV